MSKTVINCIINWNSPTRFQSAPSMHISRRNLEMVVFTEEIEEMGNITISPTFMPRKVDAQFSVTFTISFTF